MNGEKMQLLNRDVLLAVKGLLQIGNTPIDGRTSYWLARNFKNLAAVEKTVMEKRNEIIKRLGTLDEKKGQYTIPETIGGGDEVGAEPEKRNPVAEQADKEYNAILDETVEVEIMKVGIDGFGKVNLNAIAVIDFMLDEPTEGHIVRVK